VWSTVIKRTAVLPRRYSIPAAFRQQSCSTPFSVLKTTLFNLFVHLQRGGQNVIHRFVT
jgi:hypothetical protein